MISFTAMSFSSFGYAFHLPFTDEVKWAGCMFLIFKGWKNTLKLLGRQNSQRVKCYKVFEARPWLPSVLLNNAPFRHHYALVLAGSILAHPGPSLTIHACPFAASFTFKFSSHCSSHYYSINLFFLQEHNSITIICLYIYKLHKLQTP